MGVITFNGVSSKDLGLEVETFPAYQIPERSYKSITIPGRDGDVLVDTGSFKNTTRSYKVSMATYNLTSYYEKMNKIVEWLHSSSGYARLEDSYEPGVYRMAYFKDSLSIENLFDEAGRATINFVCKPQRYLKDGEKPILLESSGQLIYNPTNFASKPLIKIVKADNKFVDVDIMHYTNVGSTSGSNPEQSHEGVVKYKISIAPTNPSTLFTSMHVVMLDCELQEAYSLHPSTYAPANMNPYTSFGGTTGECPRLDSGYSQIHFTKYDPGEAIRVQSVSITPRWFTV